MNYISRAIGTYVLDTRRLHFSYDTTFSFGCKDHFFHFLLGYVIPALCISHEALCRHVIFEDCGPLMNPKLADACQIASFDLAPVIHKNSPKQHSSIPVLVPRWDAQLVRFDGSSQTMEEIKAFRSKTAYIRQLMLERSQTTCKKQGTFERWQRTDVLVLKRSPNHPYYAPGGPSRFPEYGNGRRALLNTSEIAAHLAASGRSAQEVDMGQLPLWEQITAFHRASSVVGVRGAEFAHLFWMQPGSTAVMFATPAGRENNASRSLSEIFDLRFISPRVKSNFFSIQPEEVGAYLQ